jgi:hypothetical protein
MPDVTVAENGDGTFTVAIGDGGRRTTHTVRVPAHVPDDLGCGQVPTIDLVRLSIAFLLEREPASSILRTFSLEQIGDYFPDYPAIIRRMLAAEATDRTGPP